MRAAPWGTVAEAQTGVDVVGHVGGEGKGAGEIGGQGNRIA
jgi:hypothetical protein